MAVLAVVLLLLCPSLGCAEDIGNTPFTGHKIEADKSFSDWKGTAPEAENTAAVSEGEYIWKDAVGDDTGNGKYTYPLDKALRKGADLKEFRVTFDDDNLYFLVKTNRPGDWWAPYRVIGIDTDGASGGTGGMQVLAEGDLDTLSSDSGTYAELKVAPELACEYAVALSSTYKGRIWDADAKLVAFRDDQPEDTPGFKVADINWNTIEVAIPWPLIGGKPQGKAYRFIVAVGQQDYDIAREIEEVSNEWHGGGGETSDAGGVDPDVYDLAGAERAVQERELGSFRMSAPPGDTEGFATIDKSYLTVYFGPKQ
ncbi:MAG: glucodextranase DOMON-like domain-containing protein [Candidatus Omnitrophica bacterium]|nr:glucodextranase DOMON-like domain-containing protein [Candidatus Omnitrophota bacterium]MDD5737981.1 glucodextranase DOMON-like domain-containing protein [Candidatus Omnitrophota bacterium]